MTTSTSKNPSFTYPTTGTYDVSLTVTLPSTHSATLIKTIDVFQLSDVSFTYSDDGCGTVTFTDTSVAPNIISWLWEFDDGTQSTLQNPVHTFPFPFNYAVTLTIRTSHGGIGFTQQNVVITGGTLTADFTTSISGDIVGFTDTTISDCGEVAWAWDFGDGIGTSSSQNPSYTYLADGTYTVSLTVYGLYGADTITHDVVIDNTWCYTFDFTASDGGFSLGTGTDGSISTASYVSGQGWQISGTGTKFVVIYKNASTTGDINRIDMTYTVSGDTSHGTQRQRISTKTTNFTIANGNTADEGYTTDLVHPSGSVNYGHDFSNVARKGVQLQAGCNVTAAIPITTTIVSATIQGTGTNPFGTDNCINTNFYWDNGGGTEVQFCDTTTGATGWSWDFGDGNTSTLQNPNHVYNSTGTYTATLTATDGSNTNMYSDNSIILTEWSKSNGIVSNGSWTQTEGSWNSSDGWTSEALGSDQIIDIELVLPSAVEISQLEMYYTEIADNSPGTSFVTRTLSTYTFSGDTLAHETHTDTINASAEDNVYLHTFDGTVVEKVRIQLEITNTASTAKLSNAVIKGVHVNPFYTPTC